MARIRKIQNSADYGRVLVDEQLERLEKDISSLYAKAAKDMTNKLNNYLANYDQENKDKQGLLENGIITPEEYDDWKKRRMFEITRQKAQIADLTQTMVHADEQAMAMIRDQMPEIYATSYNFGGFRAETYADAANMDYTSFTIYNADAVRILAKEDPDLLPKPKVDIPKDKLWNRNHIQNAIGQGIIQGESLNKIAGRLRSVTDMDNNAALRNARTMVNSAENRGRKEAVERVAADGFVMTQVWSATHDDRTRDSHILLDGTQPNEDGYFDNGLRYPCDPAGDPAEVYNCRCSLLTYLPNIDHSKDQELYEKMMEEEYFDDWLKVKEQRDVKEAAFQEHKAEILEKKAASERVLQPSEDRENPASYVTAVDEKKVTGDELDKVDKMGYYEMRDYIVDNPNSYARQPEYKALENNLTEKYSQKQANDAELKNLREELKENQQPKPKSEWTIDDEVASLMGERPQVYTERGEEIKDRINELYKENRTLEEQLSEINDQMDRADRKAYREQKEEWDAKDHEFIKGDINKEYECFTTNMKISQFDEDLKNGKGFIAEMTPDEYLDRISYEVFRSPKERAVLCDYDHVKEYAQMMKEGIKFNMGYIDYSDVIYGQEGRHRAIAAKILGIKKIPVYIRGK